MNFCTTVLLCCITLSTKESELGYFCLRYRNIYFSALPFIVSFFVVRVCSNLSGLFTVHFFGSLQIVMVSKNHGCKWFVVMIFTLSRLEHGWFRRNSVCCGPVYGPWLSPRFGYGAVYDSRLSLRGGFGPVCIQHLSSRTATSPMPSTLGMHSPLRTNSSMFLHPPSPQQPRLVPTAHPGGIGCVFLAAQ